MIVGVRYVHIAGGINGHAAWSAQPADESRHHPAGRDLADRIITLVCNIDQAVGRIERDPKRPMELGRGTRAFRIAGRQLSGEIADVDLGRGIRAQSYREQANGDRLAHDMRPGFHGSGLGERRCTIHG